MFIIPIYLESIGSSFGYDTGQETIYIFVNLLQLVLVAPNLLVGTGYGDTFLAAGAYTLECVCLILSIALDLFS